MLSVKVVELEVSQYQPIARSRRCLDHQFR